MIVALVSDTVEVHPTEFVTVKLYIPTAKPGKVAVVPLPVIVVLFVVSVIVHAPVAGKPLKSTLPVAVEQVGCVTAPTIGADGVEGCEVIVALVSDMMEVHPAEFVTVKLYTPTGKPGKVAVVPLPVIVVLFVVSIIVQIPVAGKPLKSTLPVAIEHVGCITAPTTGAVGVVG